MPQTQTIPTQTSATILNGQLTVETAFDPMVPLLSAFISPIKQEVDGELFEMGDLGITIEDRFYPQDIDFTVDANGDLLVAGNLAANFSLNADGELIYTY